MSSPPLAPNKFAVRVDDLLVLPEIQELLATDVFDVDIHPTAKSSANEGVTANLTADSIKPTKVGHEEAQEIVCDGTSDTQGHEWAHPDQELSFRTRLISQNVVIAAPIDGMSDKANSTIGSMVTDTLSKVVSLICQVHVVDDEEISDLCRKLKFRTAALRQYKYQKNKVRQQKLQIQYLRAQLCSLQQIEAQLKHYEQCSVELLKEEIRINKDEIADLSARIQNATKKEVDLVSGTALCIKKCKPSPILDGKVDRST